MSVKKSAESERTDTIPLVILSLTKGLDGKTNYPEWVEYIRKTLGTRFGNLSRVFTTDVEYVPPPVTAATYVPAAVEGEAAFTNTQLAELRLDAVKSRNKELQKLKGEWSNMFNAIMATVDTGSELVAAAHPDFDAHCKVLQNPNVLWRIFKETHFTNVDGAQGNEQLKMQVRNNLRREFALLVQKPGVPIAAFKKKFDDTLRRLEAVGVARPGELELSISFIDKLDPNRHGAMQAHMANNAGAAGGYPATLQAAYTRASEWRSAVRPKAADGSLGLGSAVFLTADEVESPALLADAAVIPAKTARAHGKKRRSARRQVPERRPRPRERRASRTLRRGSVVAARSKATSSATARCRPTRR
jgi:hypothetical protein